MNRTEPLKRHTPMKPTRTPRRIAATCSIRGCRRPIRAEGMCATHCRQEADRLFSLLIRAQNGGRCIRCGNPATDCSHIASRSYLATRWTTENAEPMCRGCHRWQHMHPLENENELYLRHGYSFDLLKQRALAGGKPDYSAVLADLRGRVE